jgi:hypothetical protein
MKRTPGAYLFIIMLDDLQVEEFFLVLSAQSGVPTPSLRDLQSILGTEVIRWRGERDVREKQELSVKVRS